jgi:hypothetical protein
VVKSHSDHKDEPTIKTGLNVDVCRRSISSPTADEQVLVWQDICSRFKVLRVKNTFNNDSAETFGMQQILVNILLEPKNPDSSLLTFGDMMKSADYSSALQ